MKKYRLLSLILSISIFTFCNEDKATNPDETYETVAIGNQVWMKMNLDVDHYRNGDPIPEVKSNEEWEKLTTGAWCYYNNYSVNGKTYGKLYNWYAVNDPRGLAPAGWHIPNDQEWTTLTNSLGGENVAGGKLKSTGTIEGSDGLWHSINFSATNESGFSALPGGWRSYSNGTFDNIGYYGGWWTSSAEDPSLVWFRGLKHNYASVLRYSYFKNYGFSVRCIKD